MSIGSVAVVGGGWAGLATAVTLAAHHVPVNVYEGARQVGGRARRVAFEAHAVDNGQHLFIGAYKHTLQMLRTIGVDPDSAFLRQPLSLTSLRQGAPPLTITAPRLPAPLHLIWALLRARGLANRDRLRAIQFGLKLKFGALHTEPDISLSALLHQHQQTPTLCEAFWEPLCLAIMNTHPGEASAQVFVQVLKDAFLHHQSDADTLLATTDLSRLLNDPSVDYIEQHDGHVHLGMRINALGLADNGQWKLQCDGDHHSHSHVVLAVPPYAAARLLPAQAELDTLRHALTQFDYAPICTLYLQYAPAIQLPQPMLGMLGTLSQWIFDRRVCGQPGLMAVVISAGGEHMKLDNHQLLDTVRAELAQRFPHWPAPIKEFVLREKRATFLCRTGINSHRPANRTPLYGLWLAGDYTRTSYPATLEGAIRSGVQCAHQIIDSLEKTG